MGGGERVAEQSPLPCVVPGVPVWPSLGVGLGTGGGVSGEAWGAGVKARAGVKGYFC